MSDRLHNLAIRIAGQERAAILSGTFADLPGIMAQKDTLLSRAQGEPPARQLALMRVLTAHQGLLQAARDGYRSVGPRDQKPAFAAYGPDGLRAPMQAAPHQTVQRS
jgi:hypothetical protein